MRRPLQNVRSSAAFTCSSSHVAAPIVNSTETAHQNWRSSSGRSLFAISHRMTIARRMKRTAPARACRADTWRHEAAQPFPACEGDPDRVEYRHQAIRQRNDQEQREPVEQTDAGDPRLHQERRKMLIQREEIDLG